MTHSLTALDEGLAEMARSARSMLATLEEFERTVAAGTETLSREEAVFFARRCRETLAATLQLVDSFQHVAEQAQRSQSLAAAAMTGMHTVLLAAADVGKRPS